MRFRQFRSELYNYLDFLKYSYLNYESQTDNCYFVGEKTISREAAMDTTGTYRYINSIGALGVISDALNGMGHEVDEEDVAERISWARADHTGVGVVDTLSAEPC